MSLAAPLRPPETVFPGRSCPGLIEASWTLAERPEFLEEQLFPGRSCPGLIEADDSGCLDPGGRSKFPGRSCPGLIEAGDALLGGRHDHGRRYFRGEAAPASLKLGPVQHDAWTGKPTAFPGRSCPGLIEAPSPSAGPARSRGWTCDFRGEAAPASLKRSRPRQWRARSAVSAHFRGEAAPASLKHDPGGHRLGRGQRAFPGRSCPGFIEAEILSTDRVDNIVVSGAKRPRPH